jgi:manganese oxidase
MLALYPEAPKSAASVSWLKFASRLMVILLALFLMPSLAQAGASQGQTAEQGSNGQRVVRAEVVALDQVLTYNRFGSINPYGMIFALRRDVVTSPSEGGSGGQPLSSPDPARDSAHAGRVMLRLDKRPRPMVLRGNVGDRLTITFTNLLRPIAPDLSSCERDVLRTEPYRHHCSTSQGGEAETPEGMSEGASRGDGNWPATRRASMSIPGLRPVTGEGQDPRCTALVAIEPGVTITCSWDLERQGSFLVSSMGAPVGGQGEGGSQVQGLFAVVNVQPRGSIAYRSQVTASDLDKAWKPAAAGTDAFSRSPSRDGQLQYDQLRILKPDDTAQGRYDIISSDLNAIIDECAGLSGSNREKCIDGVAHAQIQQCRSKPPGSTALRACRRRYQSQLSPAYREFTVVFHDELKTVYAKPFEELETAEQLAGVGDGFAINYGASGMGSALLANRKGIGPAKDCAECLYEEFFLQSWANGDPALLEKFTDDPSNVHHSYLNDRVVFRNLHVGKETHVFHLHAHQWETLPQEEGQGSYLDSQTIGPGQTFSYEIYRGGLRHYVTSTGPNAMNGNGSGNRNRTIGDSIFHCHLYPHFAQGMWALWRVHDVIEDGTRRLPDGNGDDRLSNHLPSTTAALPVPLLSRTGTDPRTGIHSAGTPIPALVPLPGQALPPLPTYGETEDAMPGYPFYIEGQPGRRAPQPPMDFAAKPGSDGGLPRHIVKKATRGMAHMKAAEIAAVEPGNPAAKGRKLVERALSLADMTAELETADITVLPAAGSPLERRGMAFHAGSTARIRLANGAIVTPTAAATAGYPSLFADRAESARFFVNGSAPAPGAPFADPCRVGGANDPAMSGSRRYDVSVVQLDMVTNRGGWHDPQARINVLDVHRGDYGYTARTDGGMDYAPITRGANPFYFRAYSGECITFNHSNLTPKDLELDDFQVATPTDTIGQHIHLVKFDVTSADGSGNGWNYEDGTFAPDAVFERMCAANKGLGAQFPQVTLAECEAFHHASPAQRFKMALAKGMSQTTTQRWFADPMLFGPAFNPKGPDRTLGTVFTHDHFGPSSIQQHGFYSALLIEPKGTQWFTEDGRALEETAADPADLARQADWTGPVALIKQASPTDAQLHPDTREFAMAIADFALLYDPRCNDASSCPGASGQAQPDRSRDKGLDYLIETAEKVKAAGGLIKDSDLARLGRTLTYIRRTSGVPVAAPSLPEAISADHHDPYLVNYKGEPIPLRIGDRDSRAVWLSCKQLYGTEPLTAADNAVRRANDISRRAPFAKGEISLAFNSDFIVNGSNIGHGDPCTPLLHAYETEKVSIRLIQGAQEVQHTLNIAGLGWKRAVHLENASTKARASRDNVEGRIGAQEVGISEHFELDLPGFGGSLSGQKAEHIYDFGSQDALWNGAWGLLRVMNKKDPTYSRADGLPIAAPLRGTEGDALVQNGNLQGLLNSMKLAPAGAPEVKLTMVATRMDRLLGSSTAAYRDGNGVRLHDPDALILLPYSGDNLRPSFDELDTWIDQQGQAFRDGTRRAQPLVARVRAGDFIDLTVLNGLRSKADRSSFATMPDSIGDALLPGIVSINADRKDGEETKDIGAGPHISFTLPLLNQALQNQEGRAVGRLAKGVLHDKPSSGTDLGPMDVQLFQGNFYAGVTEIKPIGNCASDPCPVSANAIPYAFGPIPIRPIGDVIGQQAHGLFGGLIVEPKGSSFIATTGGASPGVSGNYGAIDGEGTVVCAPVGTKKRNPDFGPMPKALCKSKRGFREFVLFYQDGLNLHKKVGTAAAIPVQDCPICDDSYDRGEKGVNYRSEPFWARLRETGQQVPNAKRGPDGELADPESFSDGPIDEQSNLNFAQFPKNVWQSEMAPIATPEFVARAGETVKFRVLQPGGRARQRAFQIVGNDYADLLPFAVDGNGDKTTRMGSPASALLAPGKAITATLKGVRPGCYVYRDGPTSLLSGGVWGSFKVLPMGADTLTCAVPGAPASGGN